MSRSSAIKRPGGAIKEKRENKENARVEIKIQTQGGGDQGKSEKKGSNNGRNGGRQI